MLILSLIIVAMMAVATNVVVQHRRSERFRRERSLSWYGSEGCVAYAMAALQKDASFKVTNMAIPDLPATLLTVSDWPSSGPKRKTIQCKTTYPYP